MMSFNFLAYVEFLLSYFGKQLAYCHGTVAEVFPVWVHFATKPHGLNIDDLRKRLLEESKTSAQGTIYELSVQ